MRSITVAVSVCLAITLAASTRALAGSPRAVKAFDPARIDASAKPCVDFNRYANGAWLATRTPGKCSGSNPAKRSMITEPVFASYSSRISSAVISRVHGTGP